MRPWYRYTARDDNFQQRIVITPFSKLWGYGAPATLALVIINTAIWFVMIFTSAFHLLPLETWWYKYFALTPDLVIHRFWIYQILTSVFLHDGTDILHLLMNMYLLWMFGPMVERAFGSKMFVSFYLVTGVVGSIVSMVMRLITGYGAIPSLGASSAIFGILTAYGFLHANDILLLFFIIPIKAWKAVVLFIVLETLFILMNLMQNVDHYAHLGGAMAAAIWMLVLIRKRGHRTAHGWFKAPNKNLWIGPAVNPYGKPQSKRGWRVIVGKRPPKQEHNAEGTDDEPPPDWFKI
jgi:membrane associated rhomboid family serine protease